MGLGGARDQLDSLYSHLGQLKRFRQRNQSRSRAPKPRRSFLVSEQVGKPINETLHKSGHSSEQMVDRPSVKPPPGSPDPQPPRRKSWRWWLMCFATLGVLSGMGSAALLWLVSLPPPTNCQETSQPLLDIEQLYCAQQSIQTGGLPELIAGLTLLQQWTPEDPLYAEAQNLAEEWSKQVLAIARSKARQSDLEGALEAISHIPATTPVYEEAQEFVAYWKEQWAEGEAIYAKAEEALKQQNWTLVSEYIAVLADFTNPFWNTTQANALAQQLGVEKQARQTLAKARQASEEGTPRQLGQAIRIAEEIPRDTHTWADATQMLKQWGFTLLSISVQRWQAGDLRGAEAALRTAPETSTLAELQDLIRFKNAFQLAVDSAPSPSPTSSWFPDHQQLWKMMEAIAALEAVPPDSTFYEQAQAVRQTWQAQFQDVIQLYYANVAADLGQHATLQLAIGQAQQISSDRPRRLQAQTLVAYWQEQVEQIEDQPYLDDAIELAQSETVNDLRSAIASASLIQPGRALRAEAQSWIGKWQNQIEVIEDRPHLDRARLLADEGNLSEAISAAATIQPGRALYAEAQSAIGDWQAQIIRNTQIAADHPILERARALATSGDLVSAIRVASQIAPGRALSGEAQAAIADWEYQLAPPPLEDEDESSDDTSILKDDQGIDALGGESPNSLPLLDGLPSRPLFPTPSPLDNGLPDRIETVPPSPVLPRVISPELSDEPPPEPSPTASPDALTPPDANQPPTPPPLNDSSFDGYYDERFYEDSY
ncbi:MAG: hypothetical protein Kow00121_53090 [Elainellaceae cyanobacterium]